MSFANANGARIAWQQMGQGPDLVLVHGLAASRAFWFPIAARLASTHRVWMFDLRGHGYSQRTESGYSSAQMGRDLLGLMDALDLACADVAGHSYGGGAALEAATLQPARFRRLALLDVRVQALQPQMRLQDMGPLSVYESRMLDGCGGPEVMAEETQIGFRFLEEGARQIARGMASEAGPGEFVPFGNGAGASRTAARWLELLDTTRARDEIVLPGADPATLGQLRIPTLLVYGERSRCWPSARALAHRLPHAMSVTLPDAGHFFPVTAPDFTFSQLRDFFCHSPEIPA